MCNWISMKVLYFNKQGVTQKQIFALQGLVQFGIFCLMIMVKAQPYSRSMDQ